MKFVASNWLSRHYFESREIGLLFTQICGAVTHILIFLTHAWILFNLWEIQTGGLLFQQRLCETELWRGFFFLSDWMETINHEWIHNMILNHPAQLHSTTKISSPIIHKYSRTSNSLHYEPIWFSLPWKYNFWYCCLYLLK